MSVTITMRSWLRIGSFASATPSESRRPKLKRYAERAARRFRRLASNWPAPRRRRPTVITLVADVNIQGHIDGLVRRMQGEPWTDFWISLQISCLSFADLGLDAADSDAVVWQRCQHRGAFLLTNNRNDDGPDSLATTIRTCNTPACLPVFTIGDAERVKYDRDYAERVIWALLEYLIDTENILGTGRLYLP